MVKPTSQRQSRPRDQPSDNPMTAPSVQGPALAWVRASDDTNTRARPAVEQFDPSQNMYPESRGGVSHFASYETADRGAPYVRGESSCVDPERQSWRGEWAQN